MDNTVNKLWKILDNFSPEEISFIHEEDPWRFLITVMLSASTTDKQAVNAAAELFRHYPDPQSLSMAGVSSVEALIRPAGLYRTKAPRIIEVSRFISEHGLPENAMELTALPGIGEKTAECYKEHVLGLPSVIADTHFVRVANRLGFTDTTDRIRSAAEIRERFPSTEWSRMSMVLNYHGRTICKPKPCCAECPVRALCPSSGDASAGR